VKFKIGPSNRTTKPSSKSMSVYGEKGKLADIAEAKKIIASTNAQNIIKSLLSSFPDDLSLSGAMSDSSNQLNLDDQHSGMLTPIRYDRSSAASTPSLSLPDSFDLDLNALKSQKVKNSITLCCIGKGHLEHNFIVIFLFSKRRPANIYAVMMESVAQGMSVCLCVTAPES
jgi:hypothetical protein